MEELKSFFFKTLYHWDAAFEFNFSSFHVFLDLFSSLVRCLSCIHFVYLSCVFALFNEFDYLKKKKGPELIQDLLESFQVSNWSLRVLFFVSFLSSYAAGAGFLFFICSRYIRNYNISMIFISATIDCNRDHESYSKCFNPFITWF